MLRCQIKWRKINAAYIMKKCNAATRDSPNFACIRQGFRGYKFSLSIHHYLQTSSDIQVSYNKHACLRAFADLRKRCSDELEIMGIREDNANVTDSNNKDPLCLSIGRQSAESINDNLFACFVFRNVYLDERGERINWTVITLLSLNIARDN